VKTRRYVFVAKERTVHMYAELWHASSSVLETGLSLSKQRGSPWQFLSSIVLTAFAFEAYLNHVGPQVIACWADHERLRPPLKFELLSEALKVAFAKRSRTPLATMKKLFKFRNEMAHGKTERLSSQPSRRKVINNLDDYWVRNCALLGSA